MLEPIIMRNREAIDKIANRETFRNRNGSFWAKWHRKYDDVSIGKLPVEHHIEDCFFRNPNNAEVYIVYSYETPIAWAMDNGDLTIPDVTYSITTGKHQSFARQGEIARSRMAAVK